MIFWIGHALSISIILFLLSSLLKGWAKWFSMYGAFIWLSSILDELSKPWGWDYWRYVYAGILLLLFYSSYKLWNYYAQQHTAVNE